MFKQIAKLVSAAFGALLISSSQASEPNWTPKEGLDLIGTEAPEFQNLEWVNGTPRTMLSMRGHPILIRFWLANCPLCENSAQALNYLQETYGPKGLIVIGIHHAKSKETESLPVIAAAASKNGFAFPIAQDTDWSTINAFWLRKTKRSYTSATILVDKSGHICWLHDGGILSMTGPDSSAFDSLSHKIQSLLSSPVHTLDHTL